MIGIVIVAHGALAAEYLKAIEHVVGLQRGMCAITIEADHNRTEKKLRFAVRPMRWIPVLGL